MAIKRALISVSDKSGIEQFAKELAELGVEIISTGGTKTLLESKGIPVTGISEVTGFPEILDGRVKTLHPAVHSGLLAVRDSGEHRRQMEELGLGYIDLVVVNLYPFARTIAKPDCTYEDAIENIDIGGPTMLRSAAKNHAFVTVVVDAADYPEVARQIRENGDTDLETRKRLAAKVFRHTAAYDSLIAQYLSAQVGELLPEKLTVTYERVQELRYGENPHQKAAFYRKPLAGPGSIVTAEQLHGKELSYNNINDANAALELVKSFREPAVVAVKHMNPCGVGIGETIEQAYRKAYEADPVSIFGGIVALNRPVDLATAQLMHEIFLEIIIAPDFTPEALEVLTKKKNLRLLKLGDLNGGTNAAGAGGAVSQEEAAQEETAREEASQETSAQDATAHATAQDAAAQVATAQAASAQAASSQKGAALQRQPELLVTSVGGGMLVQESDVLELDPSTLKVVTDRAPTEEELKQLLFAWKVVRFVKSNAIVLARDNMTVGVGAGQMNRVGAARIAAEQAGERARGSVMASDAFFPMDDTVRLAAEYGVTAIIQPGGSIRDEDSIRAANEHGIAMVFTGVRHFRH